VAWVDLGPVQCQVRRLATGAGPCQEVAPRLVLGVEQQDGGGIGEDQRITELACGQRAWPLPVQAQHPGADSPDPQREREDRRRPRLTCRLAKTGQRRPDSPAARSEASTGPPEAAASRHGPSPGSDEARRAAR
jgi:hypothetical protein